MKTRGVLLAAFVVLSAALVWALFDGLPRWIARPAQRAAAAAPAAPAVPVRKIKARLYYASADGMKLAASEHDVPYGEGTVEQAKEIVAAQIAAATPPLISAIPAGTTLRALFITPQNEAYVDLSAEVSRAHPGGTLNEILTIYTIVDALTENLPAIASVQILVDGKEVDTLAGHIDLRRPLTKNLDVVE